MRLGSASSHAALQCALQISLHCWCPHKGTKHGCKREHKQTIQVPALLPSSDSLDWDECDDDTGGRLMSCGWKATAPWTWLGSTQDCWPLRCNKTRRQLMQRFFPCVIRRTASLHTSLSWPEHEPFGDTKVRKGHREEVKREDLNGDSSDSKLIYQMVRTEKTQWVGNAMTGSRQFDFPLG